MFTEEDYDWIIINAVTNTNEGIWTTKRKQTLKMIKSKPNITVPTPDNNFPTFQDRLI